MLETLEKLLATIERLNQKIEQLIIKVRKLQSENIELKRKLDLKK